MIRRLAFAALLFVFGQTLYAQQLECGTNETLTLREYKRAEWLRNRAEASSRIGTEATMPLVQAQDGVFVVQANLSNAPFHRPFDLTGRMLRFTPTTRGTYTVENLPIAWDETPMVKQLFIGAQSQTTTLLYPFPIGGQSLSEVRLYRSPIVASMTSALPSTSLARSVGAHEFASLAGPVISALAMVPRTATATDVRIGGHDNINVLTWAHAQFDAQMRLFPDGVMEFAYRRTTDEVYGGVFVSTGQESWRTGTLAGEMADPADSLPLGMMDVQKVTVTRLPEAGLVEFRATLAATVTPQNIPDPGIMYDFELDGGIDDVALVLRRSGTHELYLPGAGWMRTESGYVTEGNDIVLLAPQEILTSRGENVTVKLFATVLGRQTPEDTVELKASLGTSAKSVNLDFSAISAPVEPTAPLLEAFTLAPLSLPVIWEQIKSTYKLKDSDVDGVAVYQDFTTDIVFTATAYALGGNPGVSNIHKTRTNMGPQYPRAPSLLHMNRLPVSKDDKFGTFLLLHEFGHRWLQSLELKEGTTSSRVLNPATNHPAQYVHLPAAFPVFGTNETSVMGGGHFLANATSGWTNAGVIGYGYSWLDLYLMGLADANEVLPFFYIGNSAPALGSQYHAPAGTFTGVKHDVTMQQILDPMGGPRNPAYPATQRAFRVLFVLVTDDGTPAAADLNRLQQLRALMAKNFRVATGDRAELITDHPGLEPAGPRRRTVRR